MIMPTKQDYTTFYLVPGFLKTTVAHLSKFLIIGLKLEQDLLLHEEFS